jgi:general secretion pathway protein D
VNINSGDILARDGQSVAIVHRDDPPGTAYINVARPPGAAGASGSGTVCVLRFQARQSGQARITLVRATVQDANEKQTETGKSEASVQIQ